MWHLLIKIAEGIKVVSSAECREFKFDVWGRGSFCGVLWVLWILLLRCWAFIKFNQKLCLGLFEKDVTWTLFQKNLNGFINFKTLQFILILLFKDLFLNCVTKFMNTLWINLLRLRFISHFIPHSTLI